MNRAPTILYEDDALLVIQKPTLCHSIAKTKDELALSTLLLEHIPALEVVHQTVGEAGLLQRLDYETSGCMLVAKSPEDWHSLRESFKAEKVEKTYLLLVEGSFVSQSVDAALASRYRGSKKVSCYDDMKKNPRSQKAHTTFERIADFDDFSLLQARTSTGRRHQIRAHAAHAGHPLIGDSLYGSKKELSSALISNKDLASLSEQERSATILPTFFLHAHTIRFMQPRRNEWITITAPLPCYAHGILRFL